VTGRTDWAAIEHLYQALGNITDSPVVAINHAIAIAELHGATVGLAHLDALPPDDRIAQYQPYWAARADLLSRLGARYAASEAYDRAIGLEADQAVRAFLQQRRDHLE
jgi:RNA polymerase sigma-70 factor (ECF subfamily)